MEMQVRLDAHGERPRMGDEDSVSEGSDRDASLADDGSMIFANEGVGALPDDSVSVAGARRTLIPSVSFDSLESLNENFAKLPSASASQRR